VISKDFGVDFINNPKLLASPKYAALSAGWYWNKHNLNSLADLNTKDAFLKITKIINGGYNGLDDRLALWDKIKNE